LSVMDLEQKLRQFEIQKRKIELAIAELEQLQGTDGGGGVLANRRGRKSMGSEERLEVSERMKRYWANRREQREQVKEVTVQVAG
jgi:hypothetical protein